MKTPTYTKGFILIDKALLDGFESLRTHDKDSHLKRSRVIDLIQLGHHRKWRAFPASERWLGARWNSSLGYASRLLKRLRRGGRMKLIRPGNHEGDPRLIQFRKPKRYFMLPRMILNLPPIQQSMAADLFKRASEPSIQYSDMSVSSGALSARWGCSTSTARAFLRKLHNLGLLEIVQTASKTQPTIIKMAKAQARQHPLPIPKRPPKPRPRRTRTPHNHQQQQLNLEINLKEKAQNTEFTSRVRKKIVGLSQVKDTSKRLLNANLDTYSIEIIEHLVQRFTIGHVLGSLKRHMISLGFSRKALQKIKWWLVETELTPSGWMIADDPTASQYRNLGARVLPRCTKSNLEGLFPFLVGAK